MSILSCSTDVIMNNQRYVRLIFFTLSTTYLTTGIPNPKVNNENLDYEKHHVVKRSDDDNLKPFIRTLNIVSTIKSRFSETVVTSVMENPSDQNQHAEFDLQLPDTAFISNFTMIINGKLQITEIDSKENASRRYNDAVSKNKTAGIVENIRDYSQPTEAVEEFSVRISVKAKSNITFELTYLQLLERINGMYEQVISMRPNQIVENFTTNVLIHEDQGIKDLSIFEPMTGTNTAGYEIAKIYSNDDTSKSIVYAPTAEQQRQMSPVAGLNGDFIISYDISHSNNAGAVVVERDKYFAHYFSPDENHYTPLAKNIIFVIDISGSMSGTKMDQTRASMQFILQQLHPSDTFMLLLFDDLLEYWPSNRIPIIASPDNIKSAQVYASKKLFADGATNIADSLTSACRVLRKQNNPSASNIIIFLTDGEPTVQETNPDKIVAMVTDAAAGKVTIFSLGFGFNLNFDLLKKLAYRTGGKAKRIYENEKVSQQLENFYKSISTPLIFDININYPENIVDPYSVTESQFKQFFKGSESVVVGKLLDDPESDEWKVSVTGKVQDNAQVSLESKAKYLTSNPSAISEGYVEKLYAYKKIKDLLNQVYLTDDPDVTVKLNNEAVQLALKYNLVTPLTSMILVEDQFNMPLLNGKKSQDIMPNAGVMFSPVSGSPCFMKASVSLLMLFVILWSYFFA